MSAKQAKIKYRGQPAPRWKEFVERASKRIVQRGGFKRRQEFEEAIANDIVRHDDWQAFLTAVRRGRGTHRQNLRYRILRLVEAQIGDALPRRHPDANTPDALALREGTPEILQEPGDGPRPARERKRGGRRVVECAGQAELAV